MSLQSPTGRKSKVSYPFSHASRQEELHDAMQGKHLGQVSVSSHRCEIAKFSSEVPLKL